MRRITGKKAQNMSITTIILIVLGLIVLVVLILGFTFGWGKMKDWIFPSNNVAAISDQCSIACATNKKYDYCSSERALKADGESFEGVTCYSLAEKAPKYGIEKCNIDCGIYAGLESAKQACTTAGQEVMYLEGLVTEVHSCAEKDISDAK